MVGGGVVLAYPPGAHEYLPADSGDTLYPSELRVDLTQDLLFVRMSALPKPSVSTQLPARGSLVMVRRVTGEGTDPDYIIDVDADGAVRSQGHAYVCLRGKAAGQLSAEAIAEVRRIIRASERIDTSTEKCRRSITDQPGTIIKIQDSGPPRTLINQGLCHPVEKLARALEATIGVERWIGTDEQRKTCR